MKLSKLSKNSFRALFTALRPNQWIKNLAVFASTIFTGQLFNPTFAPLFASLAGFLIFSALSSASYLLNDIVDLPYDRLHPEKKHRPLASGLISISTAVETLMFLSFVALIAAFFISIQFLLTALTFFILHVFYSFYLKKIAVLDILAIALSFFLRVLAGEVITGFHLSIWLTLTVVFLSLFIASCKRRSEMELEGEKTRPTLAHYRMRLLDFYTSTFATATILTYSLYTFLGVEQSGSSGPLRNFINIVWPQVEGRKLMILTVPFVLYGIMRYAQLIYEKPVGERPEMLVTQDKPLIGVVLLWGALVTGIIYVI